MRFAGKTAVITGAASGIGKATCLRFASEGATVIAGDIDEEGGNDLAATSGGKIIFQRTDVCNVADIKALMDFAANHTGGIDMVFNNAGAGGARERIDEIDAEGWDFTMNLLLRSVAMGMRYATPHMIGRAGASFVNTASVAALGRRLFAHCLCGGQMRRAASVQSGRSRPCQAQHPLQRDLPRLYQDQHLYRQLSNSSRSQAGWPTAMIYEVATTTQPVKGGGNPEDIASMVAYLASSEARFITGSAFCGRWRNH